MKDLISLIFRALQSEFEAVQIYKEVANESRELGKDEIANLFDEISRDEMQHIGNLEEMLKIYESEQFEEFVSKKQSGYKEVEQELDKANVQDYSKGENLEDYLKLLPNTVSYLKLLPNTASSHSETNTLLIQKASLTDKAPIEYYEILKNNLREGDTISYNKDTIEIIGHI